MASLMLHRDVLTNFGRLPAKVQKRVSELIRKFEEDSTQSSIHLEKIEQAIDGKVRSARVGDDWRAIVIAPQRPDHGENSLIARFNSLQGAGPPSTSRHLSRAQSHQLPETRNRS